VKTPALATLPPDPRPSGHIAHNSWQDFIQTQPEVAMLEGLALEHLIDHQRRQVQSHGAGQ
jgi:uncharacterized protein (DUF1800 family)